MLQVVRGPGLNGLWRTRQAKGEFADPVLRSEAWSDYRHTVPTVHRYGPFGGWELQQVASGRSDRNEAVPRPHGGLPRGVEREFPAKARSRPLIRDGPLQPFDCGRSVMSAQSPPRTRPFITADQHEYFLEQ